MAEVYRVAAKEAKNTFAENPVPLAHPTFHSGHWEPPWDAVEEVDLPVCLNFGTSRDIPWTAPDAADTVFISLMGVNSVKAPADLCFSRVLHRSSTLKVSRSEGGIGRSTTRSRTSGTC